MSTCLALVQGNAEARKQHLTSFCLPAATVSVVWAQTQALCRENRTTNLWWSGLHEFQSGSHPACLLGAGSRCFLSPLNNVRQCCKSLRVKTHHGVHSLWCMFNFVMSQLTSHHAIYLLGFYPQTDGGHCHQSFFFFFKLPYSCNFQILVFILDSSRTASHD